MMSDENKLLNVEHGHDILLMIEIQLTTLAGKSDNNSGEGHAKPVGRIGLRGNGMITSEEWEKCTFDPKGVLALKNIARTLTSMPKEMVDRVHELCRMTYEGKVPQQQRIITPEMDPNSVKQVVASMKGQNGRGR